jgi:ABC-type multidrug transport system ATPase subunit
MLEIKDISKQYSQKVLNGVSFCVKKGSVCGLFGPNGAGKSTLMKIITGLELPSSGEILWEGEKVSLRRPLIGSMIESPCFLPGLSGFENLRLLARLSGSCTEEDVLSAISRVGLFSKKALPYKKYSLGMRQRLYFAFAIMRKPSLLVLDEPFSGIDPIALNLFEKLIRGFSSQGVAILISSHEIRELQTLVDKAIFLDKGKIVYETEEAQKADLFKEFLARVDLSGEAQ